MASCIKPRPMPPFPKPEKEDRATLRKPLKKVGKRGLKRQAMNRRLDKLRIHECEIRIPGHCVRSIMLTWAHSQKSRFIQSDEEWMEAARACIPCHTFIECLSHEEMKRIVQNAISQRKS